LTNLVYKLRFCLIDLPKEVDRDFWVSFENRHSLCLLCLDLDILVYTCEDDEDTIVDFYLDLQKLIQSDNQYYLEQLLADWVEVLAENSS
jgi:hypothetical protein